MLGKGNPIQEQEIEKRINKAADSFWSAFRMMENGRVKSTLLLYSFCLCWVFIAIYGALFAVLIDPIHAMAAGMPTLVENLASALVPAILGTGICGLVWFLPGDKRLLPASYLWLALLMLACLATLLFYLKGEGSASIVLTLQFFGMFVLSPVLLGGGLSILLYYRYWKNKPPVKDVAELRKGLREL